MSSANHDEAAFPDAETFHPDRVAPAGHLAFGQLHLEWDDRL